MKRATHTRGNDTAKKLNKQRRTENQHSPTTVDSFAEEFEVNASGLADGQLDESGYFMGQVFMMWPRSEKLCKLQLKVGSSLLDVWFEGPGLEKLDFVSKDVLKISLKGVKKQSKVSPHTLPFKLVFSNGTLVKFLVSEKRNEEKVVDLFRDTEEEIGRAEDDWFCSSPQANDFAGSPPRDHASFWEPRDTAISLRKSEGDASPAHSWGLPIVDEYSRPLITDDRTHGPQVHEPVFDRDHYITALHTKNGTFSSEQPATVIDPAMRSSFRVATVSPVAGPSAAQQKHVKGARIKKRDTRHSRDSAGSVTSSTVPGTEIPDQDVQNPLENPKNLTKGEKKKKKKKKKNPQAKASEKPAIDQPRSPSPPYRDPALDLVPGFHSERDGTYTAIENVTPTGSYCLVGVVANVGPIRRTTMGDLSKSYTLVDPSTTYGYESLTVNIFVSDTEEHFLPSVNVDQILLLRNIKCKEYKGKPQGTGYKDSFQWCGYNPVEGKPFYTVSYSPSSQRTFFNPSADEMGYFVKLADWWRALKETEEKARSNDPSGNHSNYIILPKPVNSRKLQTISQFEPGTFVDCVVELLKVYPNDIAPDIYVTDYSENQYLHHSLDSYPLGRRILKVSLWDAAKNMVDDLELHGLYLLKNMRLKKLEGARIFLEGSAGYGDDRAIYKLRNGSDQENLQDLLKRKVEYESNPQYSAFEDEAKVSDVGEPLQQARHVTPPRTDQEISPIVRCDHMDQKQSTIEEVQRNNQCPNKFRVRVRIIEYYPPRIEDFVIVKCNDCGKVLDKAHHLCPDCGDLSGKSTSIRYQFALRIMDDSQGELNVSVANVEAAELLVGLDVRDAREDTAALKTRLAPLIGHLETWHHKFDEETKTDAGNWVDMCLSSWVSETSEGESTRLYKLFGCKLQL